MFRRVRNKGKNFLSNAVAFLALCLLFPLAGGCGSVSMKHYTRPDFKIDGITKIAVLPIENFTSDSYAGERIRKAVITEVLSRGIDVIEPGEVTKSLVDLKIRSLSFLSVKDIQELQKALGIEAIMTGSVEAYGISTGISASYPEVTVNLSLLEAPSGRIVWSAWNTSGGATFWTRHFGVEGRSLSETGRKVVKDAVNTLF